MPQDRGRRCARSESCPRTTLQEWNEVEDYTTVRVPSVFTIGRPTRVSQSRLHRSAEARVPGETASSRQLCATLQSCLNSQGGSTAGMSRVSTPSVYVTAARRSVAEDVFPAKLQKLAIPGKHVAVFDTVGPRQLRTLERLRIFGIGYFAEVEILELAAAAFAHRFLQPGIPKSAKNWKGALSSYSCPMKSSGVCGASSGRAAIIASAARNQCGQALSLGAIAHLIVVLNADDVCRKWHILRRRAARCIPKGKFLALEHIAIAQGAVATCSGLPKSW